MAPPILPSILLLSGAAAWLGVSLATALRADAGPRLLIWSLVSVLFIASFVWNARAQRSSRVLLAVQSASVAVMAALLCNGYEGFLLVIIAAQLAFRGESRGGLIWIGVQSLALGAGISVHWSPGSALMLLPPYLGFQLLMFTAVRLFADERRARKQLAEANDALRRLQAELAEKTRVEERLRIAQDLHDSLGHHLTALSLNLELAAHEAHDSARTTVRTAQALARALLSEVKAIVRNSGAEAPVDLARELEQLSRELPFPTLHILYASDLHIADARVSRALFRVVQEIVTNAIRHGKAQNLWITIEHTPQGIRLTAHDDGAADALIVEGFGLSGMRRRVEELGGTLRAMPSSSGGFDVLAELPIARGVAA
jgi:signal transduction histidine kinase